MGVVVKKEKIGNMDAEFVYIKDVPVYYASIQEPRDKMNKPAKDAANQSTREYQMTVFVTEEDMETLLDDVKINKQAFLVGKDKNKNRVIKYKTSDQVEEGKPHYDSVKGLYGIQLTLDELTKKGDKANLIVVDKDGNPFTDLVGNDSRVTVMCFGYRNQDGLLNIRMNLVQVLEHVPYEAKGGNGTIVDDELGITINVADYNLAKAGAKATQSVKQEVGVEDDDDF